MSCQWNVFLLQDKHLLSRLLLLLNPNYSSPSGQQGSRSRSRGGGAKKKKPIINVVEGKDDSND